jgi:hypothetical protein
MNGMIHHTAPQGSDEWLQARKGAITGSRFSVARERLKNGEPSKAAMSYAMDTARERCGGQAMQVFANAAMRTGTEQEPLARMAYESQTGNWVEEVGFFTTPDGLFGLTPDGLIDEDGALEIKTMVSSAMLFRAVVDGDISDYLDQCNGYLWLLGRQWVDLVLWAPDMTELGCPMTIIRINRDESAIEQLESDLMAFAGRVQKLEAQLRAMVGQLTLPLSASMATALDLPAKPKAIPLAAEFNF